MRRLTVGPAVPSVGVSLCHEKRGLHEAPGKSAKASGTKVCPYSHPSSQNASGSSAGNPLTTSADLCRTTPKHFKAMCRRPTPPGSLLPSQLLFREPLSPIWDLKSRTRLGKSAFAREVTRLFGASLEIWPSTEAFLFFIRMEFSFSFFLPP